MPSEKSHGFFVLQCKYIRNILQHFSGPVYSQLLSSPDISKEIWPFFQKTFILGMWRFMVDTPKEE